MADLNITISTVAEVTTVGGTLLPTTTARGIAAATILPGQAVFADPSANNTIKLAAATDSFQSSNVVGIAMGSASPNQPLTYATGGDITMTTTGSGSILTSGIVYVLSNNAGAIAPVTDNPTNTVVLGVGNGGTVSGTTTNLRIGIIPAPFPK